MPFASIPWKKYLEVEVQEIIIRCFESAGYTTKNIHKSDSAGEKGVDILVELDGRKTAIAVKIKPRGVDRAQLQDLAEYSADRRVYIYTSTPTHEFIRFMSRTNIKPNVEYWSSDTIGNELFNLDPFFMSELSLSYSEFSIKCTSIALNLMRIRKQVNEMKESEHEQLLSSIDPSILRKHILWEAKDHSSALSKSVLSLKTLFEHLREFEFTPEQQHEILKSINCVLSDTCKIVLERLQDVIEELIEKYHANLLSVASSTRYRTNWKYIEVFLKNIGSFYPEKVLDSLFELKGWNALWSTRSQTEPEEIVDFTGRLDEIRSSFSPGLAGIKFFLGKVSLFAWGLEEVVNRLYLSVVEGGFDDYFRDWMDDPGDIRRKKSSLGRLSKTNALQDWMILGTSERLESEMRITEEILKTRWHIVTGANECKCPRCDSALGATIAGDRPILKCTNGKCDYEFN